MGNLVGIPQLYYPVGQHAQGPPGESLRGLRATHSYYFGLQIPIDFLFVHAGPLSPVQGYIKAFLHKFLLHAIDLPVANTKNRADLPVGRPVGLIVPPVAIQQDDRIEDFLRAVEPFSFIRKNRQSQFVFTYHGRILEGPAPKRLTVE